MAKTKKPIVEEIPVEEIPVEETPTENSIEETPKEIPVEEIPVEEIPVEETPEVTAEKQEISYIPPPVFVQSKRGRKPGSKNKTTVNPIKVESIPELDLRLFCDMANSIAVSLLGADAEMSILEKTLFYSGIEHYSKTVGAETVQKISQNATPFFLLAGVVVWGLRIFTLYTAKKKKENQVSISNIPETVNPQNTGVSPDFLFANSDRRY